MTSFPDETVDAHEPRGGALRAPKRSAPSPTLIEEARRLYEAGELTQAAICKRLGLTAKALRWRIARGGWRSPGVISERLTLARRVRKKVEREIAAVDRALAETPGAGLPEGAERTARTLASLVKTLRELVALDEAQARATRAKPAGGDGDDDGFADLDALRDALANRLERLRAGG